jgi:hypothetical protein
MIDAGDFRYRFKLYSTARTKDAFGQSIETKTLVTDFYGSKYQWQNREVYVGSNLIESNVLVIRTYFIPNLDTSYIIVDEDNKEYNIKGVKELSYREFHEITAEYKSDR